MLIKVLDTHNKESKWWIFEVEEYIAYHNDFKYIDAFEYENMTALREDIDKKYIHGDGFVFLSDLLTWLENMPKEIFSKKVEEAFETDVRYFKYKTIIAKQKEGVLKIYTNNPCYLLDNKGQTIERIC